MAQFMKLKKYSAQFLLATGALAPSYSERSQITLSPLNLFFFCERNCLLFVVPEDDQVLILKLVIN